MPAKLYLQTQKEIDTLTKMRYRDSIDDDSFLKEKDELSTKLIKLKDNLRNTENRAQVWLDLTERTFYFATYARSKFITGTLQERREIFSSLSCNFSLKDKKLFINKNEWFIPIQKAYPELQSEFNRLELDKTLDITSHNEQISLIIARWGATS